MDLNSIAISSWILYLLGSAVIAIIVAITTKWNQIGRNKEDIEDIEDCLGDFKNEIRDYLGELSNEVSEMHGELKRINGE